MDFKGRTVIVTGASSGIGRKTAEAFARQGANVALVARGADRLREASRLAGAGALAFECDVSDREQVERMACAVSERLGPVDVLVNNAGFAVYGSVLDLDVDQIESQMKTNYFGMVYCTKQVLPGMIRRGSGHIVNVASVAASMGLPGIASYCASKSAMLGFSEGLKHELKGTGVGVTVVSPIMVRTNFFDHPSFAGMPPNSKWSLSPEGVAGAILKAAGSPRLEVVVPPIARAAIWLKDTFPYIADPIIAGSFRRQLEESRRAAYAASDESDGSRDDSSNL